MTEAEEEHLSNVGTRVPTFDGEKAIGLSARRS